VLCTVEGQTRGDELRLTATEIAALDQAVAQAGVAVDVHVREPSAIAAIRALLEREGKGSGRVHIRVPIDGEREAEIALPGRYAISVQSQAAIKAIPGVTTVAEA
jgi:DNA polymerase-3 subunit alpha